MPERYAIYVTARGALADFGAAWLGWDIARGCDVPQMEVPGIDVAAITAKPRKYGFHGTIKPPMRLAHGAREADLTRALEAICAREPPVRLDGLRLARMGGFLALVPEGEASALAGLAGRCVAALDDLRASADASELARRRAAGLSGLQEEMLWRWGYPYVMEAFRFHMTLTGRLDAAFRPRVEAALSARLRRCISGAFEVDSLTLAGADAQGRFRQIRRIALRG